MGKRILLVEDEKNIILVCAPAWMRWDIRSRSPRTEKSPWWLQAAEARSDPADLVMLQIDGFEVLDSLKNNPDTRKSLWSSSQPGRRKKTGKGPLSWVPMLI